MNTDSDLLRRYVEERSQGAFAELVQRRIGLVYSVAVRRVGGDAHLAEDVVQKVFADLARKAPALVGRATLTGWLYASAHVASAAIVRSERRRKKREAEAHAMQTTLPTETEADWTHLRPVIDDAIVALKTEEREAIALRFFEQRSFAEIGAALRVTEEAARKRVDRALDKLRGVLARRGVTSTAAALGIALTAVGTASAPGHLAAAVANHAVATANATASGSILGSAFNAVWPVAAVLTLGGILIGLQRQTNVELRNDLAQLAGDESTLASLRQENQRLAQRLAQADAWRETAAGAVPSRASATTPAQAAVRPVAANIIVSPRGTIAWEGEQVKLADYIARLQATRANTDPEARLHIRAEGAPYGAVGYVIDEARKAQIKHLTVDSDAMPDATAHGWWF